MSAEDLLPPTIDEDELVIAFPAATVVVIRDGERGLETLLLRRAESLVFGGDNWVFPGGRIDRGDYAEDVLDIAAAARRAAIREAEEEASLSVADSQLLYFAHWTTPPSRPKRFATWFFVAAPEQCDNVVVCGEEIVDFDWYSPAEALEAYQKQQIKLMMPTRMTLAELAKYPSVEAAFSGLGNKPLASFDPSFYPHSKGILMRYEGDTGYGRISEKDASTRDFFWWLKEQWRSEG